MKTIPRATHVHVLDPNTYTVLRQHWSALLNSERKHRLKAVRHLLYLMLIGKDWRKAFTPATNKRKLENGAFEGWVLFRAMYQVHSPLSE